MLSFLARAAVGRTLPRAVTSSVAVNKIANLNAVMMTPSYLPRLASIGARGFVASAWARFPAASAKSSAAKTKKKPAAKKKPTKKPTKKPAKKPSKVKVVKRVTSRPRGRPGAKKIKKVMTEEQKEKRNIAYLRRLALQQPPKGLPPSTWVAFLAENYDKNGPRLGEGIKIAAEKYRKLSESEFETYKQRARANKQANYEAYKAYIESHPACLIYVANLARRRLRTEFNKHRYYALVDERLPRLPSNAYACFVKSRYYDQLAIESHLTIFKSLSDIWNAMTEVQREPFRKMSRDQVANRHKIVDQYYDDAAKYWAEKGLRLTKTTIGNMRSKEKTKSIEDKK